MFQDKLILSLMALMALLSWHGGGVAADDDAEFRGFAREENLVPEDLMQRADEGGDRPPVIYVRDEIPEFKIPEVSGKRREAWVPATLDLAHRAELAINALTRCIDPEYDYEAYESGIYYSPLVMRYFAQVMDLEDKEQNFILAPLMMHTYHDYNGVHPKYIESMAMLRLVGGSQTNLHVEQGMVEFMLRMMGDDGLYYMPIQGRPWALFDEWGSFIAQADPPEETAHLCALWPAGRAMQALCVYATRDPENPLWREFLDRSMAGLSKMMVEIDDWGHFPGDLVFLDKDKELIAYAKSSYGGKGERNVNENTPVTKGLNAVSLVSPLLYASSRYYRISGSEAAGNISRRLARYLLDHAEVFDEKMRFLHHFHLNTSTLLGLLEYAMAFNDEDAKRRIVQSYEFAKSLGVPEIGYWPESFPPPDNPNAWPIHVWENMTSEGCGIGNMVALSVNLSRYGVADYWEDADRFIRNHFVESQLTRSDWINKYARMINQDLPMLSAGETESYFQIPDLVTTDNVAERSIGIFSTWCAPNDWILFPEVREKGMGWSGCCTGNGTRGIFYAWNGILDHRDGVLRVNLLLNRSSEWADVNSHLPYTGRVDIHMRKKRRVQVRIPQWVADINAVKIHVNDKPRDYTVQGRYVDIGQVKRGHEIRVEFPMTRRSVELDMSFPVKWVPKIALKLKGNEVVDIKPEGKYNPLYQRDHYDGDETLWKRKTRFAPRDIDLPLRVL